MKRTALRFSEGFEVALTTCSAARRAGGLAALVAIGATWPVGQAGAVIPQLDQTIVLLRHGEKPAAGLGQLDCQGLNRALALPAVIARLFGTPSVFVAPNPSVPKDDGGVSYDYIRPLATIEPSAIRFGLPVDVTYGVQDWPKLAQHLSDPRYRPPVVVIAWEHNDLVRLARALVTAQGGDAGTVPEWDRQDFDSLYVLRIRRTGAPRGVTFEHLQEGLNGEPRQCPGEKGK